MLCDESCTAAYGDRFKSQKNFEIFEKKIQKIFGSQKNLKNLMFWRGGWGVSRACLLPSFLLFSNRII